LVEWWGQGGQGTTFTPVDVKSFQRSQIGDVHVKDYEVRTSLPKLKEYLTDASPLKVDLLDSSNMPIGFSLVQNLERVVDKDGLDGYYPVIHINTKETIANLRVNIKVEAPAKYTAPPPPEHNQTKPKITLKSRKSVSGTPPVKGSPVRSQKVTFSEGHMTATAGGGRTPPVADGRRTPLADTLVSELLNQSQQLRENMRRQIESNFPSTDQRFSGSDLSDDESLHTIEYSRVSALPAAPLAQPPPVAAKNHIPSWNLPVQRMKHLAKVTRVVIHISSLQINQDVLDKICQGDAKKLPVRRRDSSHVSFFLKYKLPGDTSETSLCSRKLQQNFVDFNVRRVYPIVFNSELLEDWWSHTLQLRTFSRHLNQRTPLPIGDASVGLKHLLLHDKYSNGETLTLPLYAAGSLFRELKLPKDSNEIIGNIHMSFKFEFGSAAAGSRLGEVSDKLSRSGVSVKQSRKPSLDSDNPSMVSDKPFLVSNKPSRPLTSEDPPRPVLQSPVRERRTINSRPEKEAAAAGFSEAVLLQLRVTAADAASESLTVKHRDLEGETKEGEVGDGKEMVVTTSLFLPGVQGNLHNRLMLSRLNHNYLILEVWAGDQLRGVSKIPTEPLHSAFKAGRPLNRKFVEQRVDVVDLLEDQVVGELFVSVYVGSAKYIWGKDYQEPVAEETSGKLHASVQTSFIDKPEEFSNFEKDESIIEIHREPETSNSRTVETDKEETNGIDGANNNDQVDHDVGGNEVSSNVTDVNDNNITGSLVEICIEEARNLPTVKSKGNRVAPCCYITLLEQKGLISTQVEPGSSPVWNFKVETRIDQQYIFDPRRYLILKVWHNRSPGPDDTRVPDPETDQVLGFVAVDLSPLLASFPCVRGWYNITDWMGKVRGQVKLSVTPLEALHKPQFIEDLNETLQSVTGTDQRLLGRAGTEYMTCGRYSTYPDHLVNHVEEIIQATREGAASSCSIVSEPSANIFWQSPVLAERHDNPNLSVLERSLTKHLSDLSNIARNLTGLDDASDGSNRTFVIQTRQENVENKENLEMENKNKDNNLHQPNQQAARNIEMRLGRQLEEFSRTSSRTSLQTSSIEELPRDDQPNLADLGLVLEDLGMYLGDTETEFSRRTSEHFFQPHSFTPDL